MRLGREDAAGEAPARVGDHVSRSAVEVCGFRTGTALSIAASSWRCSGTATVTPSLLRSAQTKRRAWHGGTRASIKTHPFPSASWNSYAALPDMWTSIVVEPLVGGLCGGFGPERADLGGSRRSRAMHVPCRSSLRLTGRDVNSTSGRRAVPPCKLQRHVVPVPLTSYRMMRSEW